MQTALKCALAAGWLIASTHALAQAAPEASPASAPATEATPPDATAAGTEGGNPAPQAATAAEGSHGFALAARVSTLGLGIEAITNLHKRVNLRLQGNFFNYDKSIKEDEIDYDGKLKLQTFGALLDIHPFAGGLRLSAGAYNNGNQIDLAANCRTECEVGDVTVSSGSPSDNPRLFGGAKFKSLAPYLGLGYGNSMRGFPLHFAFDVGVLFQGSTKINLDAAGTARVTDNETGETTTRNLATDSDFQMQLAKEERSAEDSAKEFKYFPVISLTLGYRFGQF
ncbi:MAG: hypothetical protein V4709_05840 [Pseudomonadota bacterium]